MELVARAVALQPLLREHAAKSEVDRRAADEVVAALTEAGLYRLLTPARLGGYEADLRTVLEVIETLGQADGSIAWLIGTGSVAAWMAGVPPISSWRRLRAGPGCADLRQRHGDAGPTGRWRHPGERSLVYASGSPHATWATCTALLTEDAGAPPDAVMCLVPAAEARLEDTWRTVGMRGTAATPG